MSQIYTRPCAFDEITHDVRNSPNRRVANFRD